MSWMFWKLSLKLTAARHGGARHRPRLLLQAEDKKARAVRILLLVLFHGGCNDGGRHARLQQAKQQPYVSVNPREQPPVKQSGFHSLCLFPPLPPRFFPSLCGCWVKLKGNLPLKRQQHSANLPIHLKNSPRCNVATSLKLYFCPLGSQAKATFAWIICVTLIKAAHRQKMPRIVQYRHITPRNNSNITRLFFFLGNTQKFYFPSFFCESETDSKCFKHRKLLLFSW